MAKRFFYVCAGILWLSAAYQLGAESARAEWDLSAPGSVVGGFVEGGTAYWYGTSGEAWSLNVGVGWERGLERDLPVPASDVKFMYTGTIVTTTDEGWLLIANSWQNFGPFPGGPVALDSESWGKVKVKHRN